MNAVGIVKFVSEEREERQRRVKAVRAEIEGNLQEHHVSVMDLYLDYVYELRSSKVLKTDKVMSRFLNP